MKIADFINQDYIRNENRNIHNFYFRLLQLFRKGLHSDFATVWWPEFGKIFVYGLDNKPTFCFRRISEYQNFLKFLKILVNLGFIVNRPIIMKNCQMG